jgi:hypothetical protein
MIALMILGLAASVISGGSEPAASWDAATTEPQWVSPACTSNVTSPSGSIMAGPSFDLAVARFKDGASDAAPLTGTACEVDADCPPNNCEICGGGICQSACYGNEYCNGTRCVDPTACSMNCKWVKYGCCAWSWECTC